MIGYSELVTALSDWRSTQGLPSTGGSDYLNAELGPEQPIPVYRVASPNGSAAAYDPGADLSDTGDTDDSDYAAADDAGDSLGSDDPTQFTNLEVLEETAEVPLQQGDDAESMEEYDAGDAVISEEFDASDAIDTATEAELSVDGAVISEEPATVNYDDEVLSGDGSAADYEMTAEPAVAIDDDDDEATVAGGISIADLAAQSGNSDYSDRNPSAVPREDAVFRGTMMGLQPIDEHIEPAANSSAPDEQAELDDE